MIQRINHLSFTISAGVVLVAAALWTTPAVAESTSSGAITGQLTCSECWTEADRSVVPYGGKADLACAARCAAAGIPPAIAVRGEEGGFRLVIIDGPPPEPHRDWLDLIAMFVRADTEPAAGGRVRVTALDVLESSPWPKPAAANPEDLRWRDLTGAEQSIGSFQGRLVVVNFWATWCAPCIEEMPILTGIQRDYGPLGVQVVGIAADDPDQADKVLEFARKAGLTFPLWLGATTTDMASFEVGPALPATVLMDREGHVVHRVQGIVEDGDLREVLDRLIRGADAPPTASRPTPSIDRVARAIDNVALVPS